MPTRDDMISWFIALVEPHGGRLPWRVLNTEDGLAAAVRRASADKALWPDFQHLFDEIQQRDFHDDPPYEDLIPVMLEVLRSDYDAGPKALQWLSYNDSECGELGVGTRKKPSGDELPAPPAPQRRRGRTICLIA